MDELLMSSLGWELKLPILISPSVLIGILMLMFFTKKRLALISRWPYCSPNWTTLWSLVIYCLGMSVFLLVSPYYGLQIVAISCLLDIFDGKMSVAMAMYGIARSPLDRWIGKWLDPLVDKLRVVSALVIFCFLGGIKLWVVLIVAAPEIYGTVTREPFTNIPALIGYPKAVSFMERLRREAAKSPSEESKASFVGKIKTLIQDLGLIAFVPYYLHWQDAPLLADYVFLASVPVGMLSVISRKLKIAWLQRAQKHADPYFKHQDIL